MRILHLVLLSLNVVCVFARDAVLDKGLFERAGKFDQSTEELILRFGKLKAGMTPKEVEAVFPKHVNWDYYTNDRHYEQGRGFQWQTEVTFVFTFANSKPMLNGKIHDPDPLSDDWKLTLACVVRIQVGVDDGRRVNLKTFEFPWVSYDFRKKGPQVSP